MWLRTSEYSIKSLGLISKCCACIWYLWLLNNRKAWNNHLFTRPLSHSHTHTLSLSLLHYCIYGGIINRFSSVSVLLLTYFVRLLEWQVLLRSIHQYKPNRIYRVLIITAPIISTSNRIIIMRYEVEYDVVVKRCVAVSVMSERPDNGHRFHSNGKFK